MKTKVLILPLIALAACSKPPEPRAPTPTPKLPTTFVSREMATPTPVPTGPIRDRMPGARREALSEADCDTLVLRLQLIPRATKSSIR